MAAVTDSHGLTFRQDYFADPAAWVGLVALLYVDDADEGALAGDVTETIMPSAEGGAA